MTVKIGTKPNGILYLDVRLPDPDTGDLKRSRVSLDTRDMADAKRQRADWLAGRHPKHPAMGGVIAAKGRGPTVETSTSQTSRQGGILLVDWIIDCLDTNWRGKKAQRTHESNARVLKETIIRAELDTLLLKDVASVHIGMIEKTLRDGTGYAEASVSKLLGALSSALTYAVNNDDPKTGKAYLIAKPKFPKIEVRNIRERVLSEAEEVALFDCIAKRIEDEPSRPWRHLGWLIVVALDTGFRLGELLSLGQKSIRTKRWLDQSTGKQIAATYLGLERYSTKSDKPREVPATDRVLRTIPLLNAMAVKGRWFPWKSGSGGPGYMLLNLKADMEDRGFDISDVTMHSMRHTCATRLAIGGMDLVALRDWLGHSDIQITAQRYIHLMSSHLFRGAAILNLGGTCSAPTGIEPSEEDSSTTANTPPSGNDRTEAGTVALH
ncbi:site-specific integrase [Novosphingobium resinovorum]|uniref:tyrosine-type recombinase/integrase n=1 Tax=Novosphingobium TaxID=165696 RepID=UPI001B3C737F|nr:MULTISPECIES: site-specific integrase [Novosphingobium]MBF7012562.1 site-specific integrase [Novosphingobium sp. HR1a]WJM27294.1 site-specific integrase [Novosphingobium resinovorum]